MPTASRSTGDAPHDRAGPMSRRQWQLMWWKFRRHRLAMVGAGDPRRFSSSERCSRRFVAPYGPLPARHRTTSTARHARPHDRRRRRVSMRGRSSMADQGARPRDIARDAPGRRGESLAAPLLRARAGHTASAGCSARTSTCSAPRARFVHLFGTDDPAATSSRAISTPPASRCRSASSASPSPSCLGQ